MDVGQAEVAPGVPIRESGVVESHEMQDRGVQVVDVDGVLGDLIAVLVGTAVARAAPDAAAREEAREAIAMVAAADGRQVLPGGAAEFGAADDQRLVEQAPSASGP